MSAYRRHNPMLSEMLVTLLFFAVCACILVGVFADAYSKSEKSSATQAALVFAQDIAEGFEDSCLTSSEYLLNLGFEQGEDGAYVLETRFSRSNVTFYAQINDEEKLSSFDLSAYFSETEAFSFPVTYFGKAGN